MIISVASGKGGTGKTTVAVNLALSLEPPVQLLDCDVEEPNAHLFLKPAIERTEPFMVDVPEVDPAKCSGCGACAEICRFSAIVVVKETVLTFPQRCHGCGGCLRVCPEEALHFRQREIGTIECGTVGQIEFVQGRLNVGEVLVPPLVRGVRENIRPESISIVDVPPGTSCPVIAAIRPSDFVLLVTEPTPFGLNDLKLALETARHLDIPAGVIINKAGIGDGKVEEFLDREDIPLLMEIPWQREIAEAYSRGRLLVDLWPEWKDNMRKLHGDIEDLISAGKTQR